MGVGACFRDLAERSDNLVLGEKVEDEAGGQLRGVVERIPEGSAGVAGVVVA